MKTNTSKNCSRPSTIRVIVMTSLVWLLIDAGLYVYFAKYTSSPPLIHPIEHFDHNSHEIQADSILLNTFENEKKASDIENQQCSAKHENCEQEEDNRDEKHNPIDWPGEYGKSVILTDDLQIKAEERFEENQFNIVASDMIALNRTLPDQRPQK